MLKNGLPDIECEMKICLRHYRNYYKSFKKELNIDHACEAIEDVSMSIENNMEYFCHYQFIDVTLFDIVGDIIVEASISVLKRGDFTVSTITKIDTPLLTQIQIGKTQAKKRHKYAL